MLCLLFFVYFKKLNQIVQIMMAEMHDKDNLIQRASLMCYESSNNYYWQQFTFVSIIQKANLIVHFLDFRKVLNQIILQSRVYASLFSIQTSPMYEFFFTNISQFTPKILFKCFSLKRIIIHLKRYFWNDTEWMKNLFISSWIS